MVTYIQMAFGQNDLGHSNIHIIVNFLLFSHSELDHYDVHIFTYLYVPPVVSMYVSWSE